MEKRKEKKSSVAFVIATAIVLACILSIILLLVIESNLHTVRFNTDGETIHIVKTQGKGTIHLHEDPVKEGYTFEGWFFDKDVWEEILTEEYFSENKIKGDVTVYAKWEINSYTVTFKSDERILKTEKVDYGSFATAPENPAKEANAEFTYTFTAWDVPFNRIIKDLTVTAQFAATANKYMVIFKDYDGTVLETQQDILYGKQATPPANVTAREGYTFVGWDNQFSMITSNLTVTAQYEANPYSIDFISNGGSEVETIIQGFESQVSPPANPTREGYSFVGWYTDDGVFQKGYEFFKMPLNGVVLYANWVINGYSLSLNKNREGAGLVSGSGEKEYNSSITITATTNDASGYTWLGWFEGESIISEEESYMFNMPAANKIYEARWKAKIYNIFYEMYDGVNNPENPTTYTVEDSVNLEEPEKENYEFSGWYLYEEFENEFAEIVLGTTGDIAIYASWTPIIWTITYELYEGENNEGNPLTYTIESVVILEDPFKDYYDFTGWYTDAELEDEFLGGVGNAGALTLYAGWIPTIYTITYELHGGINNSGNIEKYTLESEWIYFLPPTKDGYEFEYWYYNPGHGGNIIFTEIDPTAPFDITIHAKWKAISYNITYNLNGGDNNAVNPLTYTIEDSFNLGDPEKDYYDFTGWYTDAELEDEFLGGVGNTGDLTLYAGWIPTIYTITYELYGGENNEGNPTTYTVESEDILFLAPSKEGYEFLHWYYIDDLYHYERELEIMYVLLDEWAYDLTLHAKWKAISYNITYNLNGGDNNAINPLTYTIESVVNLEDPEKENYDFICWYLDEEFENEFAEIVLGTTGDIVIYAGWTPIIWTITYELYGGDNNEGNPTTYTVESDDILLLAPTKEGFEFLYWYQYFGSGGDIIILEIVLEDGWAWDFKLNAKWKAVSYNITYNLDGGWAWGNPETYTIEDSFNLGDPEKDYYDFTGWYTDAELEDEFLGGVGNTGDLTLYAGWIPTIYTITYELHGGINNPGNIEKYTLESEWIYFLPPTKDGYEFEYWYYYPGHGGNIIFTEIDPTDPFDITIQAKWNLITTISFDSNGGSEVNSITKGAGKSVEPPDEPTKEGYTFENWYTDDGTFDNVFVFNKMPESDVVLYANWTPNNYNVSLNKNIEYAGGVTGAGSKEYASSVTITANTNIGYTWLGWFDGDIKVSTGNELVYTFNMPASDKTYIAKWRASEMTFSFEANSGEGGMQSEIVATGESLPKNIFVKEDCFFNGWAVEASGITKYFDEHTILVAEDGSQMTLYATWLPTYQFIDSSGNVAEDGEYILFGMYPQTIKAEGIALGDIADSRGYYLGSDGCYYAQIIATPFTNDYKFSTGEDITDGVIYCFKVEPIKWRILSEKDGKAFILCESVIDKMAFLDWDLGESNNYKDSSIRAWLNGEFYNITFYTDPHKEIVQMTLVDNSPQSTGNDSNPYACDDTEDFIFLPSYSEMTNPNYGFSSYGLSGPGGIGLDIERRRLVNDYSLATGAWVSELEDVFGTGRWWLRSPADCYNYAFTVCTDGCLAAIGVFYYYLSVVPALTIKTERRWLHFDSNGGSEVSSIAKIVGEDITSLIVNSEKEGYELDGWYTDNGTFENEYIFSTMPSNDLTIYAKWRANEMTFSFEANSGEGGMQSEIVATGESLPKNLFVKDDYFFNGWAVEANGITKYFDEQTILVSEDGTQMTLYATWLPTYQFIDSSGNVAEDGEYILFGMYPQTIKAEGITLGDIADSRGYYLGSDGCYYAKLTATPFTNDYKFSTGEDITDGVIYCFKVEPIKWRILSEKDGEALILCESVIENMAFSNGSNNYKDSSIRAWLNDEFYNITFYTDPHKEIVQVTLVDNSPQSTGKDSNPYACDDTEDFIFLPSYSEMTNSDYGFSSYGLSGPGGIGQDIERRRLVNDYSLATGAWMSEFEDYYGNGRWWLRSPLDYRSDYAFTVDIDGCIPGIGVYYNYFSVVPSLTIKTERRWLNFGPNGGSEVSSIAKIVGEDITSLIVYSEKEGYEFDGWYTDDGTFENEYIFSAMPSNDLTLYAKWIIKKYTVTLRKNISLAGSVTGGGSKEYDSSVTIEALTNVGYTWLGWFDGDVKVTDNINYVFIMPSSNKTYTAKWSANEATFSFNANGGDGVMSSVTIVTGEKLPQNCFVKEDYLFSGWALSGGGDVVYKDKQSILAEIDGSTYTLYAIWSIYLRVDVNGEFDLQGDYILFGLYPQTIKEEEVFVDSEGTPDSRGYYLGDDGCYYYMVTAEEPYVEGSVFSNGVEVFKDEIYWFKVEPIRWRILSESNGEALILCESIIANMDFGIDSNNYKESKLRAWLNDEFYNQAFVALQKSLILLTEVDNSPESTGSESNPYACDDTSDYIFLPSYIDMFNPDYGFSSDYSACDSKRIKVTTDYSIATGAATINSHGWWWLRSPTPASSYSSIHARTVIHDGYVSDGFVEEVCYGVAPALTIQL